MKQSKIIWIISTISMVLVCLIVFLAVLLLRPNDSSSDGTTANFNAGTTSSLSGGTYSYENLKGLTLRINQIETCNSSVVSAFVSVSAASGDVNKSFKKKDISVYVDGKKLTDFDFDPVNTTQLLLTTMLVVDKSGSMAGDAISYAKSAANNYIGKLKTNDQVGVIAFNQSVQLLNAVSSDKTAAKTSVDGITAEGDTAIYDALERAITEMPNCGRKAIIVLSDGDDRVSSATVHTVTNKATQANLPIFAVGMKGQGFDPSSITSIANATGGQYLEANTPTEIAGLYSKIDGQLTGQFVANMQLSIPKDGTTHTLKIISSSGGSETGSERTFVY